MGDVQTRSMATFVLAIWATVVTAVKMMTMSAEASPVSMVVPVMTSLTDIPAPVSPATLASTVKSISMNAPATPVRTLEHARISSMDSDVLVCQDGLEPSVASISTSVRVHLVSTEVFVWMASTATCVIV